MNWLRRLFAPALRSCPPSPLRIRHTLEELEFRLVPTVTPQGKLMLQREANLVPFREVVIPSDPAEARCLQDQIEELLRSGASDHDIFSIKLALEEALINAIKHGNGLDRNKKVSVSYRILSDRFEVEISDEGVGFDLADVPDPTAIENLERPCGRGLMLMRHYMTEVTYSKRGNSVKMSKLFRNNGKV